MGTGSRWEKLGAVPPSDLGAARLTLHWAAQLVSAAGSTLIEPRSDFTHTALAWANPLLALVGEPLPGGVCAGLQLERLELLVLDGKGKPLDQVALPKQTLSAALEWLGGAIARASHQPVRALVRPVHPLPPHPVEKGAPFREESADALRELAHWYANADILLREVAEGAGFAPVRCWPHHFDLGTLESVGPPGSDPEHARSVSLGMSPGDASYAEPYWYVNPLPRPSGRTLPDLPEGHWHSKEWFGAVLPGSQITGVAPKVQQLRTQAFLVAALNAAHGLLG